jgi:sortase B
MYLPDRTLKYQIFAAHRYDDRHIMYSFDFTSEAVRTAYLDETFSTSQLNAVIDKDVTVGSDDHIITLSTCVSGTDYRYLVQAVLVEELDINE